MMRVVMNAEVLGKRLEEIEKTIVNLNGQLNVLHGHKTEVNHWISQLNTPSDETGVDKPTVNPVE
jgi:ABC-type transporter Mla subunit MlaD